MRRLPVRRLVCHGRPLVAQRRSLARSREQRSVADDSLMDEMRAALKGDRERAEQRRRMPQEEKAAPVPVSEPPKRGVLERLGLRRDKS